MILFFLFLFYKYRLSNNDNEYGVNLNLFIKLFYEILDPFFNEQPEFIENHA